MNAHCWNCGTDFEMSLDEHRRQWGEYLAGQIEELASMYATTGFALRAEVFTDAASWIRSR